MHFDILESMLCSLMSDDSVGFQCCVLLLSIVTVENVYSRYLLDRAQKVFSVLSLAISEEIS